METKKYLISYKEAVPVSNAKYSTLQKWLHAVSMIIILWLMASGYYAALVTKSADVKHAIGAFNVALATLFTPVFFFRMYVSFGRGYADVFKSKDVMQYAAFLAHAMIYLSTAVVMVSGILMMDRDINVFGLFSIPALIADPQILGWFSLSHNMACYCLALLLVMHVAAVIKHQLSGNPVLKGMFS